MALNLQPKVFEISEESWNTDWNLTIYMRFIELFQANEAEVEAKDYSFYNIPLHLQKQIQFVEK